MTTGEATRTPSATRGLFGNAYLLLALASLCWSCNHILGRAITGQVPPFAVACVRYFLAAAILYPFARPHLAKDWPVLRGRLGLMLFLSAVGGGLFSASQYLGLQLTSAMNVSVMNSLGPALIAGAAAVMFGDRITARQVLGIAISLVGVLAIISRLDLAVLATLGFNWGDLLILFNMMLWGVYSASLRLRPQVHWTSFMVVFALLSGITTVPFWAWEHMHGYVVHANWLTAFTFVYVTLFGTIMAFVFWNRGVELIGANRAGIFLHLIPIYSALMTGALLGEPLMGYHVVGFVLILAGVWLASRKSIA